MHLYGVCSGGNCWYSKELDVAYKHFTVLSFSISQKAWQQYIYWWVYAVFTQSQNHTVAKAGRHCWRWEWDNSPQLTLCSRPFTRQLYMDNSVFLMEGRWRAAHSHPVSSFLPCLGFFTPFFFLVCVLFFWIEGLTGIVSHHASIILGPRQLDTQGSSCLCHGSAYSQPADCIQTLHWRSSYRDLASSGRQMPASQISEQNPSVFLSAHLAYHLYVSWPHWCQPEFEFFYVTFYLVAFILSLPLSHNEFFVFQI